MSSPELPPAAPVVLGRVSWKGNPCTKKNRPMVINLARNAAGGNRRLGNFLVDVRDLAERERERYFRFLDVALQDAEEGRRGDLIRSISGVLAARSTRSQVLAELDSACGEGGLTTHVLPSEDYRAVQQVVVPALSKAWLARKGQPLGGPEEPIHLIASFYLGPRQRPDLLSLEEACADLLQEAGVLSNDKWIESWDGSRRLKTDRQHPRTEVLICAFEPPLQGGDQQCLFSSPRP